MIKSALKLPKWCVLYTDYQRLNQVASPYLCSGLSTRRAQYYIGKLIQNLNIERDFMLPDRNKEYMERITRVGKTRARRCYEITRSRDQGVSKSRQISGFKYCQLNVTEENIRLFIALAQYSLSRLHYLQVQALRFAYLCIHYLLFVQAMAFGRLVELPGRTICVYGASSFRSFSDLVLEKFKRKRLISNILETIRKHCGARR